MHNDNRQGFLEPALGTAQSSITIGIIGLSGGGSHFVQQLAHLGFHKLLLCDPKPMQEKHLHRLVGATTDDVATSRPKVEVAARVVQGLHPGAKVVLRSCDWQSCAEDLRGCDIIVGCVDTFRGRAELEAFCRRFLIAYIDVGIDVHREQHGVRMAGQMIMSLPGGACMQCMEYLRPELLSREGAEYGDVGDKPQVIWLNGLVCSAGIGAIVDLLTGVCGETAPPLFLSLDGNRNTMSQHVRSPLREAGCTHFHRTHVGEPRPS